MSIAADICGKRLIKRRCPFCGAPPINSFVHNGRRRRREFVWVECMVCDAQGPAHLYVTRRPREVSVLGCIYDWNRVGTKKLWNSFDTRRAPWIEEQLRKLSK